MAKPYVLFAKRENCRLQEEETFKHICKGFGWFLLFILTVHATIYFVGFAIAIG